MRYNPIIVLSYAIRRDGGCRAPPTTIFTRVWPAATTSSSMVYSAYAETSRRSETVSRAHRADLRPTG